MPGLALCAAAVAVAWAAHQLAGGVPMLTVAVVLGVVAANTNLVPAAARPGLSFAGLRFMRAGVVLLGLQVAFGELLGLGWPTVLMVIAVVVATFTGTRWLGRRLGLPDRLSLLVAAGFSICGGSAIAAVNGALPQRGEQDERDTVTAIALVTLCGSLAIAVMPALGHLLGLSPATFGRWAGASVHDVSQLVATASADGPAALGPAVAVKLLRVAMLAPILTAVTLAERRNGTAVTTGRRPPLVPLFLIGFLVTIAVRATGLLPQELLTGAKLVQDLLFAAALFALGTGVRLRALTKTGPRALLLGLVAWALIAGLSYGGVMLTR